MIDIFGHNLTYIFQSNFNEYVHNSANSVYRRYTIIFKKITLCFGLNLLEVFEMMPWKHTSNHLPLFREVLTGNEKPFKS